MGNFHCIPSTCARVVYREYLPPVVRWRYPGEAEWQEIEGDDYTIEDLPGQCCHSYDVTVSYEIVNCKGEVSNGDVATVRIANAIYQGVDYLLTTGFIRTEIVVKYFDCIQNKLKQKSVWGSSAKSDPGVSCTDKYATYSKGLSKWELVNLVRADGQPDECKTCIFTVYKNGAIIHQSEREDCPEVEKLPCRLSDISKEIKIEKLAYLERIEVVPYIYTSYRSPSVPAPIVQAEPIPKECLNIYLNNVVIFLPYNRDIPEGFLHPDATPFNTLIQQICSAENCPPPEYEVICDCDCKDCPPGTCAVECHEHICCYDKQTGLPVLEILIEDYCQS